MVSIPKTETVQNASHCIIPDKTLKNNLKIDNILKNRSVCLGLRTDYTFFATL